MSVNDDNLLFSSEWEIDQLVETGTATLTAPDVSAYTISGSPSLPTFLLQFKPSGSSKWYNVGRNATNQTTATTFDFLSFINSSDIYGRSTLNGTVRYFIWKDKIDN